MARNAIYLVCVAFSTQLSAAANNQYCTNDVKQYHIAVSADALKKAPLDTGAEVELSRRELNTGITTSNKQDHSTAIDFNWQYTIINLDDSTTAMTNGHLHSLDFPVSWQRKDSSHTLDYYLAPVISVSSNALKNPDLLDSEALQLWAGMVYKNEMGKKSDWLLGVRADHRFGPYRVYPVAGVCWQPDANWQLQLALPDFSIRRFFSKGINMRLYAEPDGNKWHVFSDDTTENSDFFYNAIVTGISLEWQINPTFWLEFSAIKHSGRDFSFTLEDGTQLVTGAASSTGLEVSAGIIF